MKNGSISQNTGGGVNIDGTFTMTGGSIKGNTIVMATDEQSSPGGVVIAGTFKISGNPEISGNEYKNDSTGNTYKPCNVNLLNNAFITVTGTLNNDTPIGVTRDNIGKERRITNTEAENLIFNELKYFMSDSEDYLVGKYPDDHQYSGQLFLGEPVTLKYNANASDATGSMDDEDHAAGSLVTV